MKYRDHRGSLVDSMKTVQIFETREQLINHLETVLHPLKVVDVKFQHIMFDRRIGWDTWMVSARFDDEKQFGVVGYSNGELK